MVIISEYTLEPKPGTNFFYVRSRAVCDCPFCDGKLKMIGSRQRKLRRLDGETIILIIRRFRCLDCLRIHHEFPDIVVPYKRYDAETIERIMISMPAADSEDLENQSTGSEKTVRTSELDFPCELSTALRLVDWFLGLLASLKQSEKTRQTMIMRLLQIESISIDNLKNLAIGWMKSFIRAVIVTEYTRFA